MTTCHIYGILGWAQHRGEESWRSGLAVGAVTDCDHPLNCQAWWFKEVSDYLSSQVGGVPMSMAAKSSDLEDRTSGANLQMEGHMDVPSQSAKDLGELGALGSSPSCLPSWSPARRPQSNHPNTRHCLEIHVTLTKELGDVPPPSHAWMTSLVEDMLCDARTGLTKAVVMGPGRVILFYGRHSHGEGLTLDKARDATFLLTGVGTWVGKPTYLGADPMTIQEG